MIRLLGAPRMVKSVVWWRVFLAGAALCLAAVVVELALGAPGGVYAWTVGYGVAATIMLVGALAYAGRRRAPRRGPGASYHWVQFHVYGGTLFLVLVLLHTGFRWPNGAIGWGLWVTAVWVTATGLAGVLIQKWVPTALSSGLTTEVHYDRIPELVAHVRGRIEDLVAIADESVRSFYQTNLAAVLAGPETRLIYFVDITGGIQTRLRHLDHLAQFLGDADRRTIAELRTLIRTKLEMDAQYTLQRALRWWLYAHVPIAVALPVLVGFHVFAVWYY
jgi:hypothetical protein